jgi:hypothetical protein
MIMTLQLIQISEPKFVSKSARELPFCKHKVEKFFSKN